MDDVEARRHANFLRAGTPIMKVSCHVGRIWGQLDSLA